MIPNPEVGVPYIFAFVEFNKEMKKLEELKKQELSRDSNTLKSEHDEEKSKEKLLEKPNQFEKDLRKDSIRDDDLSRFESWLF